MRMPERCREGAQREVRALGQAANLHKFNFNSAAASSLLILRNVVWSGGGEEDGRNVIEEELKDSGHKTVNLGF